MIYLSIPDDDDTKWVIQKHSKIKHEILRKYLGAFVSITGRSWTDFYYIDGFAGRGKYSGGELGSPLHALKTIEKVLCNKKLNLNLDSVNCIFVEQNDNNYRHLCQNIDGFQGSELICTHKYNKSFDKAFVDILDDFKDGLKENPSFFFIDPFGYSGIPFEIYEKIFNLYDESIGDQGRPEIFLSLMVGSINRWWKSPGKENQFDILFGTQNWKEKINQNINCDGVEAAEAISNYFRNRIIEKTNANHTFRYKIRHAENNRWLYDMVHATTNFKGLKVMKDVMYRIGVKGTYEFHGAKEKPLRRKKTLDDFI